MSEQKKKGCVDNIDLIVAGNLQRFRKRKGMSQQTLAKAMDVTFQQLQKYENGLNRISAGRLKRAADRLGVMPNDFYQEKPARVRLEGLLNRAEEEAWVLRWVFKEEGARNYIDAHLDRTKKGTEEDNYKFWLEVEAAFDVVVAGKTDEIEEFIYLLNFVRSLEPRNKWIMPLLKDTPFQDLRSQLFAVVEDFKKE